MAMRERLLERIRGVQSAPDLRMRPDREAVKQSVVAHIGKIFNSSQGNALICEQFGVPDFSILNFMETLDAVHSLEAILEGTLKRFEPRLDAIKITHVPDKKSDTRLFFKIDAFIRVDRESIPLVVHTVLNANGRISVQG